MQDNMQRSLCIDTLCEITDASVVWPGEESKEVNYAWLCKDNMLLLDAIAVSCIKHCLHLYTCLVKVGVPLCKLYKELECCKSSFLAIEIS